MQTRNVAGLVTKRKTTQVAATGSMPWIESNWAYDGLGRITSQTVQKGPTGAPVQIAKQELGYFGNDNPMQLEHTAGPVGTTPKTFGFDYDYRHQLVAAQTYEANPEFVSDYEFGAAGRLARATVATSLTPGQNQNDVRARDVSYQYGDVDPERLTELRHASGAQQGQAYATYTYDAAGNQTQRSIVGEANWEYVYDGQDRLRRVVKKSPAGVVQGSEEYWYTTSGQRMLVQKRDAAGAKTELLWFIGDTQAHYDANGYVTKVYAHVSLGTPVARVERTVNATTNLEYQFHGLANNTIATVATDGTVNTNLVYAPYGELVSATESGNGAGLAAHWRRFNDKFKDAISGLGYYGARYYDNVALGWTQADPKYRVVPDAKAFAPRRANLYVFVLGNPMKYLDPDGLEAVPTYRISVIDTTPQGSTPVSQRAAALLNKALNRMDKSEFGKEVKAAGGKVAVSRGMKGVATAHAVIVMVDMRVEKAKEAAAAVSDGHARSIKLLAKEPETAGMTTMERKDVVLATDRFAQKMHQVETENKGASKEKMEEALMTAALNYISHELGHTAGLGESNDEEVKDEGNIMSPVLEQKKAEFSDGDKKQLKEFLQGVLK